VPAVLPHWSQQIACGSSAPLLQPGTRHGIHCLLGLFTPRSDEEGALKVRPFLPALTFGRCPWSHSCSVLSPFFLVRGVLPAVLRNARRGLLLPWLCHMFLVWRRSTCTLGGFASSPYSLCTVCPHNLPRVDSMLPLGFGARHTPINVLDPLRIGSLAKDVPWLVIVQCA